MAGKIRHLLLRSGRYYARVVVPVTLRQYVRKSELLEPLGADRTVALRTLPAAVARFQDQLSNARRRAALDGQTPPQVPKRPLDQVTLAHMLYSELLAEDDAFRNVSRMSDDVTKPQLNEAFAEGRAKALRRVVSGAASDEEMAAVIGAWIDLFRERGYVHAPPRSGQWRELARMFASVHLEALARSTERDRGDYAGEPKLPLLSTPMSREAFSEAVPLGELFPQYINELKLSGKGYGAERRWRPVFENLIAFLGHDDAARVSRNDLQRWRSSLNEKQLAPRTVKDVYLAAVKAVLTWACDNGRIASNPASKIKVVTPSAPIGREKGLNEEEAREVLRAAIEYKPAPSINPATREGEQLTSAKRWIPWLCAHTGARVAEIAQLRKEDVRRRGDISYVRLTPDAGSIKTGVFRDIPLHPQLIEMGFLSFVNDAPNGPLFYASQARRGAETTAQRVSTWVRHLGVIGDKVQPSHGWRHRMKTVGRELGVDARVLDAIQGHAPRTAGEGYGDVTLVAMAAAIAKFPCIKVGSADASRRAPKDHREAPAADGGASVDAGQKSD
jgi:integrase